MRGRRIPIPLPNTNGGSMYRKRNFMRNYFRGLILLVLGIFVLLQLHVFSYNDPHETIIAETTNDSVDAILSMVPVVLHKFLTPKARNLTANSNNVTNGSTTSGQNYYSSSHHPNITEIKRQIARYNDMQMVLNEDAFGPLQNDSVIIVVQVHTRITYLRHLIVSLAQARDISKTLVIFSHDYYDEDINDLVQTIDFCKVMQIFYPYSIQTHKDEFPGVDPNDCPRDMKKEQAIIRKCNNALYPDLYGHYREAKFTQTKHHWWWKANRVFDQLEVTRNHSGLVLFLEEDHYVAEDFLYLLDMMMKRTVDLCPHCNILSLGTYLKTFNYYTYNSKNNKRPFGNQYTSNSLISTNNFLNYNRNRNLKQIQKSSSTSLLSSSGLSYSSLMLSNYYNNINNNNNNNKDNNDKNLDKSKRIYVGDTNVNINNNNNAKANHNIKYNNNNNKNNNNIHNSNISPNSKNNANNNNNNNRNNNNYQNRITASNKNSITATVTTTDKSLAHQSWNYQVLPSLYSIYQKVVYRMSKLPSKLTFPSKFREVEVMPWISSKHNMGFAFNRTTWSNIRKCAQYFCSYDDYNWDWSLQHLSQQCLHKKLHAMIVKGPRVFHIGECGVHHKKKNCESNQVISKVQQVLRIARKSGQMFPRSLSLTVASIVKKSKLRKGNGGWGDKRDHQLCMNITLPWYGATMLLAR